MPMTFDVCS